MKVIVDKENKFLAVFGEMIINDYGIKLQIITDRNPRENTILERVHQTIGNILHSFKLQNMVLNDKNPWERILASTMFALNTTIHSTTQNNLAELVFGRDSIIN